MPIYEYECKKCASVFEVNRSFNESSSPISCPKCGAKGKRIYHAPPLLFKGSGFYVTDSRKKSGVSEESGQPVKTEPGGQKTAPESTGADAKPGGAKSDKKPEPGKKTTP